MSTGPAPKDALRPLDAVALQRVRTRLLAAPAPWLHGEVARRMAERLPVVKLQPRRVLDWWSTLGASQALLRAAYPGAAVVAVDRDDAVSSAAGADRGPWWSPRRWSGRMSAPVAEGAVLAASADLVWSNMGLHGAHDPRAAMQRWHESLAPDGFLMFSTLGPGTLVELRALYARCGWPSPFAPFVDMHDLGDMLVQTGFADPVMDQETLTLHWPTPQALLAELRTLGGNIDLARHRALRTPRWHDRLLAELQASALSRPTLSFEVVYGHAVRVQRGVPVRDETVIGLDRMRSMVRREPRRGGE
jgi:malonyl-CoA O-methyltransferase